jgi:nitrate/nitrite transporter NarK
VFIIEGLLTVALVIIWWPVIKEKPEEAKWLSTPERDFLVQKIGEEQARLKASKAAVSYKELLAHPDLWKLAAIYFCIQIGVTGYSIWLPTLVKTLTKTGMATTGILSGLPYAASVFGMYLCAARSDKTGNRRFWAGFPALCFALCFLFSTQTKSHIWVSYTFLLGCGFFVQAHNPTFWSIPPILFTKEIAGGARGLVNGIGNLGGFFGPVLVGWFITVFHSTDYGLYGLAFFLVMAFLLSFTLPVRLTKPIAKKESAATA